ncbi:MAG TPA: 30S ribosomal protein S6 [Kiritimatiellia bacterium]|nr:30S ribosomal protein S6 [Kiritimatiellia bacterium]HMO98856.1 30S ribosomal protein S6 [Kiritimatiellia bacterium]HMP97277.1 30S ribosomal protein S6 [Kiritimatiellia bacterium]
MNKYEAMFIFPDAFSEEQLDNAVGNVKSEIEKVGGQIESAIRMGRRSFAREMAKTQAGQYVVFTFALGGKDVEALKSNLRFNEDIFRMQIFRVEDKKPAEAVAVSEQV